MARAFADAIHESELFQFEAEDYEPPRENDRTLEDRSTADDDDWDDRDEDVQDEADDADAFADGEISKR